MCMLLIESDWHPDGRSPVFEGVNTRGCAHGLMSAGTKGEHEEYVLKPIAIQVRGERYDNHGQHTV